MPLLIIILIFSVGFQRVDAFTSSWDVIFSNDQEKVMNITAITDQGYQLSVVHEGVERRIILPHTKIKSSEPSVKVQIQVYLDSARSNSAYLLGIQDSTLYLAGQTEGNEWRTLSLKTNSVQSVMHDGKPIDLSLDWYAQDSGQFKYLATSPISQSNPPHKNSHSKTQESQLNTSGALSKTKDPSSPHQSKSISNAQNKSADSLPWQPVFNNSLYLESETDDAFIFLQGLPTIVSSPYRFKNLPPSLYPFELRWEVNENLWSAHGEAQLTTKTHKKVFLKSERNRPELTIQTIPSQATIKFDNSSEANFERHWVSPVQIRDLKPGIRKITLLKPGYKDTTLFVNVMASEPTLMVVELESDLTVENAIFHQSLERKRLGATLFWASIPVAALGVVYHAMAEDRLKEAWQTKDQLRQYGLHTQYSDQYQATKKTNRQAVREASSHYDNSRILFGFATILSLSRIVLYF